MRINDVTKITRLTKKAITYYEQQGLISPTKDDNGYRDYNNEEVVRLKEIALYRKLDISIAQIIEILHSKSKTELLKNIIVEKDQAIIKTKLQQKYITQLLDDKINEVSIDVLSNLINSDERAKGECIKNELLRAFPGGFGIILAAHFSPYLVEPINSDEKYDAWIKIVEFLDNLEEISIPEKLVDYYSMINNEELEEAVNSGRDAINDLLYADEERLEKYKTDIDAYINTTQENYMKEFMEEFNILKKEMNKFFTSSGYYEVFIPNMKVLSSNYREYYDKLMAINEKLSKELGIRYDENMNIIRDNSKKYSMK